MVCSYRLEASKAQRASQGRSLSAFPTVRPVTRSLTFTLHNCGHLLESLSLSRCLPCPACLSQADLLLTSSCDTTVTPHTCSWLPDSYVSVQNFFGLQGTSCQYSRYLLPTRMHHRKLPSGTQSSGTTREESAARVQLPQQFFCWQLAGSHCTLFFWCMDK